MKIFPVILITMFAAVSCNPTDEVDGVSDVTSESNAVREKLKVIHMEDRIDEHYAGGDIGTFLDQIVWSDDAIILAGTRFGPFIDFFDALRMAANEEDLSKHSPITNSEIPLIFREVLRDVKPFGDVGKTPLSIEIFYQKLELYRSRLPEESKGEQGESGKASPVPPLDVRANPRNAAERSAHQKNMKIAKNDISEKLNVPGAIARQELNFGNATGYGSIAGEYFSLKEGTDIKPLLKGLEADLCQSPHWGYMIEGEVTVSYADGTEETVVGEDLFYWPPGHSIRVGVDAEIILFSPQAEHCAVVDHLKNQLIG